MSMQQDPLVQVQSAYSRWLTEEVYKLIDMVRKDEAIYNARHKYYFCRPYVENFWREVDLRLRKNPGASLAKWTNLRISFRREFTIYLDEKVPPCWTYFDKMFFLHPYLRNKKTSTSGPQDLESHLQEAIAQLNNTKYKPQGSTTVSPNNDFVDTYLSYCEDDPQASPGTDDIIEEDTNSLQHQIKSECDNDLEEMDSLQENDEYKDIIVEISDNTKPPSPLLKRDCHHSDTINRSLLKRRRPEPDESSGVVAPCSNISFVRPLATSLDTNSLHHSMESASRATSPHASSSGRLVAIGGGSGSPVRRNELCECKTDSDAMFLMSLLPDIRKLHGRDRGKIKIAFQNILQEFLYPD